MKQPSTTPYLIRAIYEWCVDNGFTPYLAVKVNERTKVPLEYVRDGEIILNVSADATRDLTIGNEVIQFSARFNGVSRELSVPVDCVSGVFAKETGQGLAFQQPANAVGAVPSALAPVESTTERDDKPTPPTGGKPRLQVVK
jgi:stringent starvation protein B